MTPSCRSMVPCRALQQYVCAFAERRLSLSPCDLDVILPVSASLQPVLQLDFGDSPIIEYVDGRRERADFLALVGSHTYRRASVRLQGNVDSFGIFFRPLALWQLFRVPMAALVNSSYYAGAVLGNEVETLWKRLAECESFEARVRAAENYLLGRAAGAVVERSPIIKGALEIVRRRGAMSVKRLASQSSLSIRQLERAFYKEMGVTPKLFARIARFQSALDSKISSPRQSWLDIAYRFGYYDQMHMIRDFQSFAGVSPSSLLHNLGDMRPDAVAAASGRMATITDS